MNLVIDLGHTLVELWHTSAMQRVANITLRHPGGHEEVLDSKALLSRVANGGLAEGAHVRPAGSEHWQTLALWYLDHSKIEPLPDPEDAAYVEGHTVAQIDQDKLRELLGFRADLQHIHFDGQLSAESEPIVFPSWAEGEIDLRPTREVIRSMVSMPEIKRSRAEIRIPQWGRPYALQISEGFEVPAWQDPSTASFALPKLATTRWQRINEAESSPSISASTRSATELPKGEAFKREATNAERTDRDLTEDSDVDQRKAQVQSLALEVLAERKATLTREADSESLVPAKVDERLKRRLRQEHKKAAKRDKRAKRDKSRASQSAQASEPAQGAKKRRGRKVAVKPIAQVVSKELKETKYLAGCGGCLAQTVFLTALVMFAIGAVQDFMHVGGSDRPEIAEHQRVIVRSSLPSMITVGNPKTHVLGLMYFDPTVASDVALVKMTIRVLTEATSTSPTVKSMGQVVLVPWGKTKKSQEISRLMLALAQDGHLSPKRLLGTLSVYSQKRLFKGLDVVWQRIAVKKAARIKRDKRARLNASMAWSLGLQQPSLLLSGLEFPADSLKNSKVLGSRIKEVLPALDKAVKHAKGGTMAYWSTMASTMSALHRKRYLKWFVVGKKAPLKPLPKTSKPLRRKGFKAKQIHFDFKVPEHAARQGPDDARLRIVVFGGLRCKFTKKLMPRVYKLKRAYGDDAQVVFIHHPLEKLHPGATALARVALAANAQGRFWSLYQWLSTKAKGKVTASKATRWLKKRKGFKSRRFKRDQRLAFKWLKSDKALAEQVLLRGTPTTFLNGRKVNGAVSAKTLTKYAAQELIRLNKAKTVPAAVTSTAP